MVTQQLQFGWNRDSSSEGEAQGEERSVCQVATASERTEPPKGVTMEEVVRRENLQKALKRVSMPNRFFAERGLLSLLPRYEALAQTT